jgi:hypothetical protein
VAEFHRRARRPVALIAVQGGFSPLPRLMPWRIQKCRDCEQGGMAAYFLEISGGYAVRAVTHCTLKGQRALYRMENVVLC